MFEGFYVSIYRAVIRSCIGKNFCLKVFSPAFIERKKIEWKWKLHDVKIFIPNNLFTEWNVQGCLLAVWKALTVEKSWVYFLLWLFVLKNVDNS